METNSSLGKCSICHAKAVVLYPLLPGSPRFCASHHNQNDAGPFGVDLSNTFAEDYDIPAWKD